MSFAGGDPGQTVAAGPFDNPTMVRLRGAILVAALAIAGAVSAFAASLSFAGGSLGMASIDTPRCTSAGLGVIPNLAAATVISVTVSGLPAGCGNATIQVTVHNQVTSSGGSASVPSGGGSVTVSLAAAVAITAVEQIDLMLTGP